MGDKVMARYVCKRQDQDKAREGLVPPDGIGGLSEVVVAVDVPRYARRGCSFVAVYRRDKPRGPLTCLWPGSEVSGTGQMAARLFLESMGWAVRSISTLKRQPAKRLGWRQDPDTAPTDLADPDDLADLCMAESDSAADAWED